MNSYTSQSQDISVNDIGFHRLLEIYTGPSGILLNKISQIITPAAASIANIFYEEMLSFPESQPFLDNVLVDNRLHHSLTEWLKELFFCCHSEEDVKKHIQRQQLIGNVHARISVPIQLVNHGFRIIKQHCCQTLIHSDLTGEEIAQGLIIINEVLDHSVAIINARYVNEVVINEHNAQSLRINAINHNLAMECEHLRCLLFDWLRRILTILHQQDCNRLLILPSIHTSDFGLWVLYKAELFFTEYQDLINNLKLKIQQIDESVQKIILIKSSESTENFEMVVTHLNERVTQAAWLISSLIEHARDLDSGRDPLTRLFNRRYIPTVIQQAIRINMKNNGSFAILLFDIDHFKRVNDTFGHDQGDVLLVQFGELLVNHVRAGDFVFRYGGEEFLVLLGHASIKIATYIAERLCNLISQHRFTLKDSDQPLEITTSVGVAVYEGHPDYSRVVSRADQALYQAKLAGRNRVVLADSS